jgi:hypothetical protein
MAVDSFGNVYVTGGRSHMEGGASSYETLKYDPDGNLLWDRQYDGPGGWDDFATGIAVDSEGNVYVTGESVGELGMDFATVKYDADGNQLWVERYDGPALGSDSATAIALDDLGNAHVTGSSWGIGSSSDYATVRYVEEAGPGGVVVVWEQDVYPVDLASLEISSLDTLVSIPTDLPGVTGKLYHVATLYSSSSQVLGQSELEAFFITDTTLSLTLETDKLVYRPDETITIFGQVTNRAAASEDCLLTITQEDAEIHSESFTLAAGATHSYTVFTTSVSSFTVTATVDGVEVTDFVTIDALGGTLELIAPDVVGLAPFDVGILVTNTGDALAFTDVSLLDETWGLAIPAGESRLIQTSMSITEDITLVAVAAGDIEATDEQAILMGESARIIVTPEPLYLEGPVEIPFTAINTGIITTEFEAAFSIDDQSIVRDLLIPVGESANQTLPFDLTAGIYTLHYSSPFEEGSVLLYVAVPALEIVLPTNTDLVAGQEVTWTFTIRNAGSAHSEAHLQLIAADYMDTKFTWVSPGEEAEISFTFIVPDDLEDKVYQAIYEFNGVKAKFDFTVHGPKVSVIGSLDHCLYEVGDTAVLTLEVTNESDFDLSLYARVGLGDFGEIRPFKLMGLGDSETLEFLVPVDFDSGKLFYGIYMDSGRALPLNALYLHERQLLSLCTDKQVYYSGETVTVFVEPPHPGLLEIAAPGYSEAVDLTGGATLSFVLPELTTGTYHIDHTFNGTSAAYPFDVIGYSAIIKDFDLDKDSYATGETMTITAELEINRPVDGFFNVRIYDQAHNLIDEFDVPISLVEGENKIQVQRIFSGELCGMY